MQDLLIPLGLLLFIVFFVYAIIHTGRKQKKEKAKVYRDFAHKHGLRYQEEDDGKAQRFAKDFDGIGRFSSPSLGKVIPKDVVDGKLNGTDAILFRHSIRLSKGWTREWFVAGLTNAETIAKRCAVQFCRRTGQKSTMYLQDPVVREQQVGPFYLVVRAADLSSSGKILDQDVLKKLSDLAANLSFRVEIQVRDKHIVVYPADRNETIDDVDTLENLFDFASSAASVLD